MVQNIRAKEKKQRTFITQYCLAVQTKQKQKAYLAETTNMTFRRICTNNFISFWTSSATQIMNVSVCEETWSARITMVRCYKWICHVIRHELSRRTASKTACIFQIVVGFE
tara:strand:+ start:205 stop:537 length:333 start_codon:yes stop_codon:yes gene_type:complete